MASYCTTWKLKDVIAHIAFFDYCAAELLNGRGEKRECRRGRIQRPGRALPCFEVPGHDRRRNSSWWREQRTIMNEAFIAGGPKSRVPWAAGIPHVQSFACVCAPYGALGS